MKPSRDRHRLATTITDQFLLADDDKDVVVGFVLVRRQRRIDPVASRVAAKQYDLQDTRTLPWAGGIPDRVAKFLENDLDDALKLSLLCRRKVVDIGAH